MERRIIELDYDSRIGIYSSLENEALFIINRILKEKEIKINNIEHRIKDKESFIRKVINNEYEKPFEEIRDLLGIRVITLFLSDIDVVTDLMRENFDVIEVEDKINSKNSDFGYLSFHMIVKIKGEYIGPRYDNIKDILFEIQVRTITMNSWANISHYLDYKSDYDIPKELKKDFYALSGLFYVADKHFEMFFRQRSKKKEAIEQEFKSGNLVMDQEINFDTLKSYLQYKLPDREHYFDSISELVEEVSSCGYKTLQQIEDAFEKTWDAFLVYEIEHPPLDSDLEEAKYSDVGVVRMLLDIYDDNFSKVRRNGVEIEDLSTFGGVMK